MAWSIHYKHKGAIGYRSARTLDDAVKHVCDLQDQGADVTELVTRGGRRAIDAAELARLCAAHRAKG
jgi:hypothetical protein